VAEPVPEGKGLRPGQALTDPRVHLPEEIEEAVTFSTDAAEQIMAFCDHKKYTAALVTLDTGKVERLAKSRGIACAADLLAVLTAELNRFRADPKARRVQPAWAPLVFQIVPEPFSDKDGTASRRSTAGSWSTRTRRKDRRRTIRGASRPCGPCSSCHRSPRSPDAAALRNPE